MYESVCSTRSDRDRSAVGRRDGCWDAEGGGVAEIFRNHLRLREGPGAIDAEHIAGLSEGIHQTMVNSTPDSLNDDQPIAILNRWPKDWDAAFTLLARGGFVLSAAQQNGTVPLVEIVSPLGGRVAIANPWKRDVTLYRNGKKAEDAAGGTLVFATTKGERVVIVPKGTAPAQIKVI